MQQRGPFYCKTRYSQARSPSLSESLFSPRYFLRRLAYDRYQDLVRTWSREKGNAKPDAMIERNDHMNTANSLQHRAEARPINRSANIAEWVMSAGVVLILITGLIHLIDMPSSFDDATYKGVLFALNAVGALVAAMGIYRNERIWGWGLGIVVAGGACVMYIISRTLGLPGLPPDEWLEPLGLLSLAVEGIFTALAIYTLAARPASRRA